jgi:hypothetical protein
MDQNKQYAAPFHHLLPVAHGRHLRACRDRSSLHVQFESGGGEASSTESGLPAGGSFIRCGITHAISPFGSAEVSKRQPVGITDDRQLLPSRSQGCPRHRRWRRHWRGHCPAFGPDPMSNPSTGVFRVLLSNYPGRPAKCRLGTGTVSFESGRAVERCRGRRLLQGTRPLPGHSHDPLQRFSPNRQRHAYPRVPRAVRGDDVFGLVGIAGCKSAVEVEGRLRDEKATLTIKQWGGLVDRSVRLKECVDRALQAFRLMPRLPAASPHAGASQTQRGPPPVKRPARHPG